MSNNLSIQEMMEALQKSGASTGSSYNMGMDRLNVQNNVTNTMTAQANPAIEQNKQAYLAQLAKIAEADKQLAGVYGDPTSPLYIERAGSREKIYSGVANQGYKAAQTPLDVVEQKKKELEANINATLKIYDELTSMQKATEVENKRLETEANKPDKVDSGNGEIEITKAQKREYQEAGLDVNDRRIRASWDNTPDGFKKWFTQERADGKIKDKTITPKELEYWKTKYKQMKEKKKEKKKEVNFESLL